MSALSFRAVAVTTAAAAVAAVVGFGLHATPAHADPSADQLEQKMDSDWKNLESVGEHYKQAVAALQQNQAASNQLAQQIAPLAAKVDGMHKIVGGAAAEAYMGGKASSLNSMFSTGSPTEWLDQMSTLDRIAGQKHAQVASYEDAKNQLDAKKQQYDKLVQSNQQQSQQLAQQKAKLNADMQQMQEMYMKTPASKAGQSEGLPANMPYIPGPAGKAVRYAINQIGKPYVFATSGPDTFDCSGLTKAAWESAGAPHMEDYTYSQLAQFPHVSRDELQPGDLVFWNGAEHMGIYIGQGMVIHAPQPGEYVKVSPLDYPGSYYAAVRPSAG